MEFSKNKRKTVKSLHLKKNRKETGLFLVEGEKSVIELIESDFKIQEIFLTEDIYTRNKNVFNKVKNILCFIPGNVVAEISSLESNNDVLAIAFQKNNLDLNKIDSSITIVLDDVRDPGNLGTIIRTCDWYGIKKIICSETSADFYNPKTIISSMGSFTRVECYYTKLENFLEGLKLPILGAYLDGENVHTMSFPEKCIILMGNESNGISQNLESFVTNKITIPRYGKAESLNVAMATGVILDNLRRKL